MDTQEDLVWCVCTLGLSGLTDLFDGLIARKCNQITELGKLLDPVADKLTQAALVFCLATQYRVMWVLLGLLVVKESFMMVMGLMMLKRNGRRLNGAKWYGKVCTFVLYVSMGVILLFGIWLSAVVMNVLVMLCAGVLLLAFVLYILEYRRMWKLPESGAVSACARQLQK